MVVLATFKYDDPRLKMSHSGSGCALMRQAVPSCDIFNLRLIIFGCWTHYHASSVYCLPIELTVVNVIVGAGFVI